MRTIVWFVNLRALEEEIGKRGKTKTWMIKQMNINKDYFSKVLSNKVSVSPPLMDKILCCFVKNPDGAWRNRLYDKLFRIVYVGNTDDNR